MMMGSTTTLQRGIIPVARTPTPCRMVNASAWRRPGAASAERPTPKLALSWAPLGAGLAVDAPAWAEDTFTSATPAVTDIVTSGPAPDDPIIIAMFTIAVGALAVVTLGVAYLSLVSWNDSRIETEDRMRSSGKGKKAAAPAAKKTTVIGSSSEDDEDEGRSRRKNPKAAATSKGFGQR